MADAKKCDRCNRLYEYPKTPYTVDRYTVMVLRPYTTNKTLDLCLECTKELNKFMNKCEDKKNGRCEEVRYLWWVL